jgi:broad specificity phosphatase PhoE
VDQALGWLRTRGVPVIALAEWQEHSPNRCDIGRPVSEISKRYQWADWSYVDPTWPAKEGLYGYSDEAVIGRGIAAKRWLEKRPEKVIAVVSHAGFLAAGICGLEFGNADFRVFEFEEGEKVGDMGPQLVESAMTAPNGGGMGRGQDGISAWEDSGSKNVPNSVLGVTA